MNNRKTYKVVRQNENELTTRLNSDETAPGITLPWMNIIRNGRDKGFLPDEILDALWSYGKKEERRISKSFGV